jgi:hypothetical protein
MESCVKKTTCQDTNLGNRGLEAEGGGSALLEHGLLLEEGLRGGSGRLGSLGTTMSHNYGRRRDAS